MVVHTFNARTWETEEEKLCVPGQSGTLPQNNTTLLTTTTTTIINISNVMKLHCDQDHLPYLFTTGL